MRYLIAILALAGIVVSALALPLHYSTATAPCDINAHWDCGAVNHSRYSAIHGIPVAAIGIAGYAAIAILALLHRYRLLFAAALAGLGFSLYLTNIEAHVLEIWCLYCVISQCIMGLIFLVSTGCLIGSLKTKS